MSPRARKTRKNPQKLSREALVARNWQAFRTYKPAEADILKNLGDPHSTVEIQNQRAININVASFPFYTENADTLAAREVDAYLDDPDQINLHSISYCNLSPVSRILEYKISARLNEDDGAQLQRLAVVPVVDIGYAFVFGVGLGYHVEHLVRRKLARRVVLIEPIAEFIIHSFSAIDWHDIFEFAEDNGITISFILDVSPDRINTKLSTYIAAYRSTFLDGSYAYLHYSSWVLMEARRQFNLRVKDHYISSGFFEDEINMVTNTYNNMRRWPMYVVDQKKYLEQNIPVFIVGSGPSLDNDLQYLAKWADRAIIVSAGTALGVLLKNGIRPDFHVENENGQPLVDNLGIYQERWGLQNIILMASFSVKVAVGEFFDERWYYFRAGPSNSSFMRGEHRWVEDAGPLVGNAAAAAMLTLGFRQVYLVGCDCGRRQNTWHHSRDSLYIESNYAEHNETQEKSMDRMVPGNFGGLAETNWSLDLSRAAYDRLQRRLRVHLFNCSDGAKIEGAEPRTARSLSLPPLERPKEAIIDRVRRQLTRYEPPGLLDGDAFRKHAEATAEFQEKLDSLCELACEEGDSVFQLEQRLGKFHAETRFDYLPGWVMLQGSLEGMVRLLGFYANRISDEDERQNSLQNSIPILGELLVWIAGEIEALLLEMAEFKDLSPEIGDIMKRPPKVGKQAMEDQAKRRQSKEKQSKEKQSKEKQATEKQAMEMG